MPSAQQIESAYRAVHDRISAFLAREDGSTFREDTWDYERGKGGGITRVWEDAALIEKGGVNFSAIHGQSLPQAAATAFKIQPDTPFFATGVSLVIHPRNPHVPTIHMNIRYFEAGETWWFGGGIDLTPYVPVRAEAVAFHRALKAVCEHCGEDYAVHKKTCDEYFFIKHRNEMRGIGGIFFDDFSEGGAGHGFALMRSVGDAFLDAYLPIVQRRVGVEWGEREREHQLYRRGRYVEFNLVWDRGTHFGLQSGGRTESILLSMPPMATWSYQRQDPPGSAEHRLVHEFLKPQDWL